LAASPSLAVWRLRLKYFLPRKASITIAFLALLLQLANWHTVRDKAILKNIL
jgi:hypothetical protein